MVSRILDDNIELDINEPDVKIISQYIQATNTGLLQAEKKRDWDLSRYTNGKQNQRQM